MNDGELLLRAILETPEDDILRLVYADWLEENGERERAEFIRLLVENRVHDVMECRRFWDEEELDLYPLRMAGWQFRRGFLNEIELVTEDFFRYMKVLFNRHPITKVRLTDFGFGTSPRIRLMNVPNLRHQVEGGLTYLPEGVRKHLRGGWDVLSGYGDREYNTREEAESFLSEACVQWGRELVGLSTKASEVQS